MGPYGFIIYAHYFKVVGLLNSALKYADDFTLIVPENTDVSAEDEMRNVLLWSDDNKLSVNLSKCKEIVFRRPSVKLDILPDPLADIERVSCAKLLGVFIDCRLKFTEHVDYVIKISNQRLYLLQQLRKQGLSDKCLDVVFCAIILSIITYALSAWGGYVTKDNINRINKTLAKAKRYGFCSKLYTFNELLEHYDDRLFSRMAFSNHCLHHLLEPDSSTSQMTLRTRGHSFNLPRFHFDLTKKSFIFRSLYGFI